MAVDVGNIFLRFNESSINLYSSSILIFFVLIMPKVIELSNLKNKSRFSIM